MLRWPNLFIAGAPRCGTSSLHSYLQLVPGVYMSRIKEPNYFSRVVVGSNNPMVKPIRDERHYLRLFSDAHDAKVIGEASPTYLEDPDAAMAIDKATPGARVLVSLRDPVQRLHSHYLMMRNNRPAMGSFMEEIQRGLALQGNADLALLTPATGLYSRQVERFRRVFGEGRLMVLVLEEWRENVPRTMRQILRFLGIEQEFGQFPAPPQRQFGLARGPMVRYVFGNRTLSRASEAWIPYRLRKAIRDAILVKRVPKPPMELEAREFLINYYRDDVRRLEAMLGRRLPWRNFRSWKASPSSENSSGLNRSTQPQFRT